MLRQLKINNRKCYLSQVVVTDLPMKNEIVTAGPEVRLATSPARTYIPRPKVLPIPGKKVIIRRLEYIEHYLPRAVKSIVERHLLRFVSDRCDESMCLRRSKALTKFLP